MIGGIFEGSFSSQHICKMVTIACSGLVTLIFLLLSGEVY